MKNWNYIKGAKTGNESLGEYMAKKPRVINEEKTGAEEFFKQLSDDVKEREDKDDADIEKVGNSSIGDLERELANLEKERRKIMDAQAHAIVHMEEVEIRKCDRLLKENEEDKKYIIRKIAEEKAKGASASQLAKELDRLEKERRDISQKIFKARETMDYMEDALWKRKAKEKDEEIKQLKRQIDRLKVGNANLETSVEKGKLGLWNWYVHKDGTIVSGGTSSTETNAKEMARKALEKEKVGNALFPASKYDDEIYKLEMEYQNVSRSGGNPSEILKKTADIEKKIHHLKELRSKEIGKIVDRYKAGNAKTGNAAATFFIIAPNGEKVKAIDYDQWHYKCVDTGELVEKRFSKRIGNSASDDKFAYVMREFDEGKLKTPDGKVVTDPAQAKAIAYSESKKTENGIARARNAMNKKTGNAKAVTIFIKGEPGRYTFDVSSGDGGYLWGDSRFPGYFKTKEEAIRRAKSAYPNGKIYNP